jgi:ribosomal protein S18 acetylase RimI-like enzyme
MVTVVREADLKNPKDAENFLILLSAYAEDPMGGGEPLPEKTKENLIREMLKRPIMKVYIAYYGKDEDVKEKMVPAGVCVVIESFTTFSALPLWNVHDFGVLSTLRRKGIGKDLLNYVALEAKKAGMCKITLEVLANNDAAKGLSTEASASNLMS